MEVCFVDVAQGSSSVILLGSGRAIVIDCGGFASRTVVSLLRKLRVTTIERLVVTHNHADHSAGAVDVFTAYQGQVKQVWMVHDTVLTRSVFFARICEEIDTGRMRENQFFRLEYRNGPTHVYRDANVLLSVLAPNMLGNIAAVRVANPNATSGVLVLKLHDKQLVFSGDSTIPLWQSIYANRGHRPINCLLMTAPHHGGRVWERQRPGEGRAAYSARVTTELDWLFHQAVRADYGVFSVGTSNGYGHPRADVIDAFRRSGGYVYCTQMTDQCDPDLEAQRARALPLAHPSRSCHTAQHTPSGASSNVACGGTLLVEVQAGRHVIHRITEHQASVDRVPVSVGQKPLCR